MKSWKKGALIGMVFGGASAYPYLLFLMRGCADSECVGTLCTYSIIIIGWMLIGAFLGYLYGWIMKCSDKKGGKNTELKKSRKKAETWKKGAVIGGVWGVFSSTFGAEKIAITLSDFYIGNFRFQLIPLDFATIIGKIMVLPGYLWAPTFYGVQDYGILPYFPLVMITGVVIGAAAGFLYGLIRGAKR